MTLLSEGLREAIARALHHDWHADEEWDAIPDSVCGYYRRLADVTLALPDLAALRAKADAADRVRALLDAADRRATRSPARMFDGEPFPVSIRADRIRRALDGPQC